MRKINNMLEFVVLKEDTHEILRKYEDNIESQK